MCKTNAMASFLKALILRFTVLVILKRACTGVVDYACRMH